MDFLNILTNKEYVQYEKLAAAGSCVHVYINMLNTVLGRDLEK